MGMEAVVDLRSRKMQIEVETTDGDLSRGAIAGDADAFEALYVRHADAAWRVAQAVATTREDAADAVSEAFTRMLQALADGRIRADVAFRPYLLATTRNAAIDQYRYRARVTATADVSEPPATGPTPPEQAADAFDAGLVSEAFRALPERWRSVLWLTEVEGMPVHEVGNRLGLSPNGTAQLARRARIGLRERYLQAHLQAPVAPACAATAAALGAYVDGGLTPSATARIDQHLAACDSCRARATELEDVGRSLRTVAPPIPAGLAALSFARYRSVFGVAGRARKGLLTLGESDLTRPLTIVTTSLLAAGVIAAGLMTGGGGPSAVAGARSGGAVGNPPTVLTQLAGSAGATPTTPSAPTPGTALQLALSLGATNTGTTSGTSASTPSGGPQPPGLVIPPTQPPSPPAPGGSPGGTDALLQLELGANLGIVSTSTAVGVGGGCTGVSVNKSPSCAPAAPSSTGVNVGLNSPLGPIIVDVPPSTSSPSATQPSPTAAPARALATSQPNAQAAGPATTPLVSVKVGALTLSV